MFSGEIGPPVLGVLSAPQTRPNRDRKQNALCFKAHILHAGRTVTKSETVSNRLYVVSRTAFVDAVCLYLIKSFKLTKPFDPNEVAFQNLNAS